MIYDAIKKIAVKKGMSIRSIERTLHFSNGTISKWNIRSPKVSQVDKVANVLEVSSEYILNKAKQEGK